MPKPIEGFQKKILPGDIITSQKQGGINVLTEFSGLIVPKFDYIIGITERRL